MAAMTAAIEPIRCHDANRNDTAGAPGLSQGDLVVVPPMGMAGFHNTARQHGRGEKQSNYQEQGSSHRIAPSVPGRIAPRAARVGFP
jgi:hypothetical protein